MAYTFDDQLNFMSVLLSDSNTDSESQFPLAIRKAEINHAEKQFARDTKMLLEKASGTASSKEISMPSGWLETFVLYVTVSGTKYKVTNNREISPKKLEEADLYAGDIPYYYYWIESGTRKIILVGSSALDSASYELFYFKQPTTDLDLVTDTSDFPEEYRQASVYKAASSLLLQIGQYVRSEQLLQKYDRLAIQAREESERHYINHEPPSPDVAGLGIDDVVDRQGMDNVWGW
jgi:hypothetical protein